MQLIINLPDRETVLARNRQRWQEVHNDSRWANHPYRIETDGFGRIVMTPPAGGAHSGRQENILLKLKEHLGGRALPECPISTVDGVRAADIGWYSLDRYASVRGQLAFETAPEICVEILSPRNTSEEMQTKRRLYFEAGALECWQCDLEGRMSYYIRNEPEKAKLKSARCPDFPDVIED